MRGVKYYGGPDQEDPLNLRPCHDFWTPPVEEGDPEDKIGGEDEHEWTNCQWSVRSTWQGRTCGRGAVYNAYGLSLCWQHEDGALDHVIMSLERGRYNSRQVERVVDALRHGNTKSYYPPFVTPEQRQKRMRPFSQLADSDLVDRIQDLMAGKPVPHNIIEAVDQLITKRLQQKWGS